MIIENKKHILHKEISNSWSKITPFWPLNNLIAVNPLSGFENIPFHEAMKYANAYFQQEELPKEMIDVNRETIKWLQIFFDEGQSTIQMPMRHMGLLKSVVLMIEFDSHLHHNDTKKIAWLQKLPTNPDMIISLACIYLGIADKDQEQFFTLMLTTLPGWASYIQYKTICQENITHVQHYTCLVTHREYLALRLIFVCLLWPEAKKLLLWYNIALQRSDITKIYNQIVANEYLYRQSLFNKLNFSNVSKKTSPQYPVVQFAFCIDVRSESFRRVLESQGDYETYGVAGFFGMPISIENYVTGESYSSCPVWIKSLHNIVEYPQGNTDLYKARYDQLKIIIQLYQSIKYNFVTSFSLVETIGIISGLRMILKSFVPRGFAMLYSKLKSALSLDIQLQPNIKTIPLKEQVKYATRLLKSIGLTEKFAPLIILCGHGSTTENNAYASALDCGACGGHNGLSNARIMALILNSNDVRDALKTTYNIIIPQETVVIAAKHNTTTDAVDLYEKDCIKAIDIISIKALKQDLDIVRRKNSLLRLTKMGIKTQINNAQKMTVLKSTDWAQVRPEWGLAQNASLIIGPRWMTQNVDLHGSSFLHSYEWNKDQNGVSLEMILTGPMVVSQWINAQYFFSTLDNIAFGGGSKITQNIVGKIGIMQGNASDLMHGLPLQSVFKSDNEAYHKPIRLIVVVHAPQSHIDLVIKRQAILQKLCSNGWIYLICMDPIQRQKYILQSSCIWSHV